MTSIFTGSDGGRNMRQITITLEAGGKTPMYEQMRAMMTPEQLATHDASLANLCLGGQMGDMETDFIPVMAFMASDSSKFITGQTISVDGGIMMVR